MSVPATPPPIFKDVDGVWTNSTWSDELTRSGINYENKPNDVFIVTGAKAGTTWMQVIVYSLQTGGRAFDENMDDFIKRTPFLENDGEEGVKNMRHPGAIKTHLDFEKLKYHPKAKYICVERNPKDMYVAFYHFSNSVCDEEHQYTFDEFFEWLIAGQTPIGDYFDHLFSLWQYRNKANVLFFLFEDMKEDPHTVIRKVAAFLQIELTDELLERVAKYSSYEYMRDNFDTAWRKYRANPDEEFPEHLQWATSPTIAFVREGKVHGGRELFSAEQNQRLNKRLQELIKRSPDLSELAVKWGMK